eukprot:1836893-Amphidinium_carterae.1
MGFPKKLLGVLASAIQQVAGYEAGDAKAMPSCVTQDASILVLSLLFTRVCRSAEGAHGKSPDIAFRSVPRGWEPAIAWTTSHMQTESNAARPLMCA